jgi:putative permease
MAHALTQWWKRKFSDPEIVSLLFIIAFLGVVILWFGSLVAPILVAVVLAYLLDWPVRLAEKRGVPRQWGVVLVFSLFLAFVGWLLLVLLPLAWAQLENLSADFPRLIRQGQSWLLALPSQYPGLLTEDYMKELSAQMGAQLADVGRALVSVSLASLLNLAAIAIYLILVPLMVFFFLKDKAVILGWIGRHLPRERKLSTRVWQEVDAQIGNYIRGKVVEILVVGVATYLFFAIMGLHYALLLGVLVGLSVLVPYIGAAAVTVPVAMVGYVQWGFSTDFTVLMVGYLIIQALDGNLLVPLLFSEAVSLHPVAIIGAVLLFGGLWGFWGVFFAIPLATLVKALFDALEDGHVSDGPASN